MEDKYLYKLDYIGGHQYIQEYRILRENESAYIVESARLNDDGGSEYHILKEDIGLMPMSYFLSRESLINYEMEEHKKMLETIGNHLGMLGYIFTYEIKEK